MAARIYPADGALAVRAWVVRRRRDLSRLKQGRIRVAVEFQAVEGVNIPVTPVPVKIPEFAAADV